MTMSGENRMDGFKIAYVFEDVAHENFVKPLVRRWFQDNGMNMQTEDKLAERGGNYKSKLKDYLRYWKKDKRFSYDLIILVLDGPDSIKTIQPYQRLFNRYDYQLAVVYAIPDPYVERWYLLDENAFKQAVRGTVSPPKLPKKTGRKAKEFYKDELRKAIRANGIEPQAGGAEYGERIASLIQKICFDASLKKFVDDLEREKMALKLNRPEG